MPTVAVIPVKSFQTGNHRLQGAVTDDQRRSLGRALAHHVIAIAEECDLLPLVVTADTEVATWATSAGVPSLPDPGEGLNAAAAAGVEWAAHSGSRWMLLHSDLPLLERGDLGALIDAAAGESDVIAPSCDGGTSALVAARPIAFAFGTLSFHNHLRRLHQPAVVARTGLLHDLDSPADLSSALQHPRGGWLAAHVR